METREELSIELETTKVQMNIIVYKRWKKIIVRWLLGIPLYYYFWDVTWMHYLFWFGLGAEVILSTFTLMFYIKAKSKIERIEGQLAELNTL